MGRLRARGASSAAPRSGMFGNKTRDYSEGVVGTNEEEVSDNMAFGDHRMWSVSGDSYFPCEKTEQELPSGQYLPVYNENRGIYFVKKAVTLDNLMVLPDSKTTYVLDSIDDFWKREDKFREFGFLWKRGILLYGPPGSGKTSCLQQMSQKIIDNGGIAVYCTSPQITAEALRLLRRIEPNRPVVVLLEDIDAIISRHGEPDLLALLDGELQIDNVVYIATTNYPEDLDPRFVQRPSRFDEVILIDMPSADARMVYLGRKNPTLTAEQLEYWTSLTEGFSLAALKEVVVAVECLGKNLEETVKRIKEIMARKPSSEDATNPLKKGVGFT